MDKTCSRQLRVYIAGPITTGDQQVNYIRAKHFCALLLSYGFAVYCVHTMNVGIEEVISYDQWMENDLTWVGVSDVVFRMPGDSPGADDEVVHAYHEDIAVVYTISELLKFREDLERTECVEAKTRLTNNN